jgi:hypothetical protein
MTAPQPLSTTPSPMRRDVPLTALQQAVVSHAARIVGSAREEGGQLPGYARLLDELLAIIDSLTGVDPDADCGFELTGGDK